MSRIILAVQVEAMSDRNASVAEAQLVDVSGFLLDPVIAEATGSSKREQGDIYDFGIGSSLAIGRALINLGRQMTHAANAEVTRRSKAAQAKVAEDGI